MVRDETGLGGVVQALEETDIVGLDTETTGLNPRRDRVRLLQLALDTTVGDQQVFVIDLFGVDPSPLWPCLSEKTIVAHNWMFDGSMLWWSAGFRPDDRVRLDCTQTLARVLRAGARNGKFGPCGLRDLCRDYLDLDLEKSTRKDDWSGDLSDEQFRYAALDAAVLRPLRERLLDDAEREGLLDIAGLEARIVPAMIHLGNAGVVIDEEQRQLVARELDRETESARERLDSVAPKRDGDLEGMASWKWGSNQHVLEALALAGYDTKTLKDTKSQTLAKLDGELPRRLLEFRGHKDKSSKFGSRSKFKTKIHDDGRVYGTWDQLGNVSGRSTCKEPNLQGVLKDQRIRRMFVAPEGSVLVKADFAAAHLRLVAKLVDEKVMLDAFARGEDLHRITAQSLLGRDDITKDDRQLAKAVAFGFLYGMQAPTFREYALKSYGVNLTLEEAETYRKQFFDTYPALRRWHDDTHRARDRQKETRTPLGRRRLVDERTPLQERLNNPVLGAEADAAKEALALLWERRGEHPEAKVVLWVHDEFVVEAPEASADAVAEWLRTAMEDGMRPFVDPIPPVVEATIARTWGGEDR